MIREEGIVEKILQGKAVIRVQRGSS